MDLRTPYAVVTSVEPPRPVTKREVLRLSRSLELAALSRPPDRIAAALGVSLDTVKAHLKAIFGKIGTDSRLAVAALAHTVQPFSQMPPLWKLETGARSATAGPAC